MGKKKLKKQTSDDRRQKKREWKVQFRIPKFLISKDEPIVPRAFTSIDYGGGILVFFISWAVYLHTLTPTIGLHDSGEMVTAAFVLGIPHPPGYPFYCLLGKLWITTLPIGNIAYRMNLASALCASLACMMVYFITLKVGRNLSDEVRKTWREEKTHNIQLLIHSFTSSLPHLIPATLSALMLAFATTFWIQAVVAEKYTLNILFATILIFILIKWQEVVKRENNLLQNFSLPPSPRLLYLFSFIAGVAFTHHFQTIYLVPATIYLILIISWQAWISRYSTSKVKKTENLPSKRKFIHKNIFYWKSILRKLLILKPISIMLLLFILPLFLYLYLPLRAAMNPSINWDDPDTLERFIDHISARDYRDYMKSPSIREQIEKLKFYISKFFTHQFTPYLTWLGPIGAITLFIINRNLFIFLLLIILMNILSATCYSIYNIEDYYILTFALFAIFNGCGIIGIVRLITLTTFKINPIPHSLFFKIDYFIPFTFLALLIFPFTTNYQYANRHQYYFAYDYGNNMISQLEENTVAFIQGDITSFPLFYLQFVEECKPNILFIDVTFLHYDWYINQMKEKHSELKFELLKERIMELKSRIKNKNLKKLIMDEIVKNNFKKVPFYILFEEDFIQQYAKDYHLIPRGLLWKIVENEKDKNILSDNLIKNKLRVKIRGTKDEIIDDGITFDINRTIKLFNNYAKIYSNEGVLWYKKGNVKQSIKNFEKSINLNPSDVLGYLNLGEVYLSLHQYQKAIICYKKLIKLAPNDSTGYAKLGCVYLFNMEYGKAIEEFKKAIKLAPNNVDNYYKLAESYYKKGEIKNTAMIFNKILEIDPNRDNIRQALLSLESGRNITWK
ncbi:MAG: DUF2723 domain-containing protein [bacterium]